MPADLRREKDLFSAAIELGDTAARTAFLDRECAADAALRRRLDALLVAHDHPDAALQGRFGGPSGEGSVTVDLPEPTERQGAVIAGRYTLLEEIGEGGMGTVWVAKQTEPVQRRVALKLIKAGMDSKAVLARFEQERQALAMMDHPNIAKVLDGGLTADRRPYFVMELVNGLPLTRFCDEARLTPRQRLELFVPICQAVQHAHQKGIIHRDLKPANILVTIVDGKPVPKVIDFGVAKATGGRLTDESLSTQFGAVVGTLEYMSPEQAGFSGQDVDTRADIYSLGVILYELLTGLKPHDGKRLKQAALAEMVRIIQEEEPSKPSTRLSTNDALPSLAALRQTDPKKLMALLRGELDWVVMKCLEKQRDRRYETANALARDIQRQLADEPVEARPPSARYRLGKFLRRHRGPVLAAALVLIALAAGVVGTTIGMVRAERQRALVATERDQKDVALREAKQANEQAMVALRSLTGEVVQRLFASQPSLTAQDRAFLKRIMKHYEAFAATQGDDADSRSIRAEGHHRLGVLQFHLGDKHAALSADRQAIALLEQLAADFPDEPAYRRRLATNRVNVGTILLELGRYPEAEREYVDCLAAVDRLDLEFPAARSQLGNLYTRWGKPADAETQYRQAVALLRKMLAGGDPTGEIRSDLAHAHIGLGTALFELGKLPEAEAELRRAVPLLAECAAAFPEDRPVRRQLAALHNNLGGVLARLRRADEAEVEFRRSLALGKDLVARFPAVPAYRNDLALGHTNLGVFLERRKKWPEAEAENRLAIELAQRLVEDYDSEPDYREVLARGHNGLGVALKEQRKWPEAEAELRLALDGRKRLKDELPTVPNYAIEWARSARNFADLLTRRGQPAEALEWLDQSIRTVTPWAAKQPPIASAVTVLIDGHWDRAQALKRLERYAEAIQDLDKAIELDPGPEGPRFRMKRAVCLVRLDPAKGVAEAEAIIESPSTDPALVYDAACVCALASGKMEDKAAKEANAARTLALLQRARAAGYFRDPGNLAAAKQDTDFDSLRGREDFKKLLAELEGAKN